MDPLIQTTWSGVRAIAVTKWGNTHTRSLQAKRRIDKMPLVDRTHKHALDRRPYKNAAVNFGPAVASPFPWLLYRGISSARNCAVRATGGVRIVACMHAAHADEAEDHMLAAGRPRAWHGNRVGTARHATRCVSPW